MCTRRPQIAEKKKKIVWGAESNVIVNGGKGAFRLLQSRPSTKEPPSLTPETPTTTAHTHARVEGGEKQRVG